MSASVRVVSGEASESDEEELSATTVSAVVTTSQQTKQGSDGRGLSAAKARGGQHLKNVKHEEMVAVSPARQKAMIQSSVVSGEASESSDEEIEVDTTESQVTPLQVNQRERGDSVSFSPDSRSESQCSEVSEKEAELKYDTLFHRKLREKNANLRRHFCETLGQVYISSAKEVRSMTQGLLRSLIDIQDASENMRSLTNTLFSLEDKVDIISSCSLLPNIDISPTNTPTTPEPPPTS